MVMPTNDNHRARTHEREPEHDEDGVLDDLLGRDVQHMDTSAAAALNRSEIEMQVATAHRFPRSIKRFLSDAITMATMDEEVAGSCIYALPRGNKTITGPSVRLAEIVASAYGNLHVGSRVLDAGNKEITAQGVAWDIEKNYRVVKEAQRRITDRGGGRYNDDMVIVTGNAAASVAFRNAVFTVIPRAYVDHVMAAARRVAVGDAKGLYEKREKLMERLQKLGVTKEQILAKVGKESVEDIGVTEVELLIGFGTAIKDDPSKLEEFFPTVKAEKGEKADAKPKAAKSEPKPKEREPDATSSLEDQLRAQKTREPEPPFGKPPGPNTHRGEPTDGPPPDDDPDKGP
jgi:hypothetical protein